MAKLPFAQAPSMGLNAFFAFTLCQAMGLSWQQALAVLLIEGVIFILITFLNIRDLILDSIPVCYLDWNRYVYSLYWSKECTRYCIKS